MSVAFPADRRLYLTADRLRLVEEGNPESAFLFVAPGQSISAADAARFGLIAEDGKVVLLLPAVAEAKDAEPTKRKR